MYKPVFDIVSEDLADVEWFDCRLVMEVGHQYFHYVVLKGNNSVVALKYYQFASRQNKETKEILEDIIKQDIVLKERMKECVVIYNYPENCLVPEIYFDDELNNKMLDLVHGDLNRGISHSEKIRGWDIYNIYRIPQELSGFFQRYFLCGRASHFYSLWLECQHVAGEDQPDAVSAIFYPNEILTTVIAGNQLQLVQSFNYKSAEDIAWHLLNIYKRFNLSQSQTPLQIGGMIAQNSAMYEELLKYFLVVNPYSLPEGLIVTEQFSSYPEHFFSPLLKLAVCVL
jgi:hypothetical protein